ncbi:hypothetical protein A1D29_10595 [Pasteurellaceae bacterium Orientalotternb1]|nr:hypothetical protein A1D29_10595 [Pasteurellaceae bacterium Orientalotternb1]
MTPQQALQQQADELCNSMRYLTVIPSILRWQQAEYERLVTVDKMEVMEHLGDLSKLFEAGIASLMTRVEKIDQILFDIEMAEEKH